MFNIVNIYLECPAVLILFQVSILPITEAQMDRDLPDAAFGKICNKNSLNLLKFCQWTDERINYGLISCRYSNPRALTLTDYDIMIGCWLWIMLMSPLVTSQGALNLDSMSREKPQERVWLLFLTLGGICEICMHIKFINISVEELKRWFFFFS